MSELTNSVKKDTTEPWDKKAKNSTNHLSDLKRPASKPALGTPIISSWSTISKKFLVLNQAVAMKEVETFLQTKKLPLNLLNKFQLALDSEAIKYLEIRGDLPKFNEDLMRVFKVRLKFQEGFSEDSFRVAFKAVQFNLKDPLNENPLILEEILLVDLRDSFYSNLDKISLSTTWTSDNPNPPDWPYWRGVHPMDQNETLGLTSCVNTDTTGELWKSTNETLNSLKNCQKLTKFAKNKKVKAETLTKDFDEGWSQYIINFQQEKYTGYMKPSKVLYEELKAVYAWPKSQVLFRALRIESLEDLDYNKLGIYWTPERDSAKAYWGDKAKNLVVITAKVLKPEQIDWLGTVEANMKMEYVGEDEVTLLEGCELEIQKIESWTGDGFETIEPKQKKALASGWYAFDSKPPYTDHPMNDPNQNTGSPTLQPGPMPSIPPSADRDWFKDKETTSALQFKTDIPEPGSSGFDSKHQYIYNGGGGISWQQKEHSTGLNLWKKTESRPLHRWELTSMSELSKDFETYWMDLEVAKNFQHRLSLVIETPIKQAYLLWLKSERHISDVERIGPDVATSKGSFVFYCRIKTKAQKGYDKDSIRAIFEAEYFKGQPTLFLTEFMEIGPKIEVYKKYKDKTPVTSAVTSKNAAVEEPQFKWKYQETDGMLAIKVFDINTGEIAGSALINPVHSDSYEYQFEDEQSLPEYEDLTANEYVTTLEHLEIDPEFRGKGLSKKILNLIMDKVKKRYPDYPIYLNASPMGANKDSGLNLTDLVELYKRVGFKVLKKYPDNVTMWMPSPKAIKMVASISNYTKY